MKLKQQINFFIQTTSICEKLTLHKAYETEAEIIVIMFLKNPNSYELLTVGKELANLCVELTKASKNNYPLPVKYYVISDKADTYNRAKTRINELSEDRKHKILQSHGPFNETYFVNSYVDINIPAEAISLYEMPTVRLDKFYESMTEKQAYKEEHFKDILMIKEPVNCLTSGSNNPLLFTKNLLVGHDTEYRTLSASLLIAVAISLLFMIRKLVQPNKNAIVANDENTDGQLHNNQPKFIR